MIGTASGPRVGITGLGVNVPSRIMTNDEIAQRLGISVAAVKLRLHGAYKKLNVRNRTQLSNQARRR